MTDYDWGKFALAALERLAAALKRDGIDFDSAILVTLGELCAELRKSYIASPR